MIYNNFYFANPILWKLYHLDPVYNFDRKQNNENCREQISESLLFKITFSMPCNNYIRDISF